MCVKKGFDLILEDFLDTIKNGHGSRGHFVLFWFLVELALDFATNYHTGIHKKTCACLCKTFINVYPSQKRTYIHFVVVHLSIGGY